MWSNVTGYFLWLHIYVENNNKGCWGHLTIRLNIKPRRFYSVHTPSVNCSKPKEIDHPNLLYTFPLSPLHTTSPQYAAFLEHKLNVNLTWRVSWISLKHEANTGVCWFHNMTPHNIVFDSCLNEDQRDVFNVLPSNNIHQYFVAQHTIIYMHLLSAISMII